MSIDALPLNAYALEACPPLAGARSAGHTLTLRLRFAPARGDEAMAGSLSLESRESASGSLRAAVLAAPAKPLTITM